jgi:hypothetical protein
MTKKIASKSVISSTTEITQKDFLEMTRHCITYNKMSKFKEYISKHKDWIDIEDEKGGLVQWVVEKQSIAALKSLKEEGANLKLVREKIFSELVFFKKPSQFYQECYDADLINDHDIKRELENFALQYHDRVKEASVDEIETALQEKFGQIISFNAQILLSLSDCEDLLIEGDHNKSQLSSNESAAEKFCKKILKDREAKIIAQAEQYIREENIVELRDLLKGNQFLQKRCHLLLRFYVNEILYDETLNIENGFEDNTENSIKFIELLFSYYTEDTEKIEVEDILVGIPFKVDDIRIKAVLVNLANKNPSLCEDIINTRLYNVCSQENGAKLLMANFIFFRDLINNYQGNFEEEIQDLATAFKKLENPLTNKNLYRAELKGKIINFSRLCMQSLREPSREVQVIACDEEFEALDEEFKELTFQEEVKIKASSYSAVQIIEGYQRDSSQSSILSTERVKPANLNDTKSAPTPQRKKSSTFRSCI